MQDSAFALAMRWRIYLNVAKKFEQNENCLFVRYEDWICDNVKEQQRLFEFLSLPNIIGGGSGTLDERIPDSQKHLHLKISECPDRSRAEAWRNELSLRHRMIIEGIAGHQLSAMSYDFVERVSLGKLAWYAFPDAWRWVSKKLRRG